MSEFKIASRYAKSLAGLAQERGVLNEVHQDMLLFTKVCEDNRSFRLLLRNPIISRDIKLNTIRKVFSLYVNSLTISFFEISVRKHREDMLEPIAVEFHKLYNRMNNVEQGQLVTAAPLNDDMLRQFEQEARRMAGKEVELKVTVDPELIGGFVLTIGDKQIDDSVRSRLNDLRKAFSYNPYIKEL